MKKTEKSGKIVIAMQSFVTLYIIYIIKRTKMNKTTNVIAAAVMVMTGLGSCATSKQPAAKDADMNVSKIVEIEKLDSEYLVLSDAQQSALRSINGMAFDLMRTQAGMDSKVVSPISVSYLMAMLANGANGTTRAEIMKTLGVDDSQMDALNEVCKSLIDKASRLDSQTRINVANCIAVDRQASLNPDYVTKMKNFYDAEVTSRDFGKASTVDYLNGWCQRQTHGMIPRIIDQLSADDVAVLMNAIYFNGTWADKFDKADTRVEPFHGYTRDIKRAPMMHREGRMYYARMQGYGAVVLPYGNGNYTMTVMLPYEGKSVTEVMNSLDASVMDSIWRAAEECRVDLKLPRFTIATETRLNEPMAQLGAATMFTPGQADFSQMTAQPIYISGMLQKAKIEVSEEGTKAAAVTSVMVRTTALEPQEPWFVNFHADRPFIYMITHRPTGAIFFVGQYTGDDL